MPVFLNETVNVQSRHWQKHPGPLNFRKTHPQRGLQQKHWSVSRRRDPRTCKFQSALQNYCEAVPLSCRMSWTLRLVLRPSQELEVRFITSFVITYYNGNVLLTIGHILEPFDTQEFAEKHCDERNMMENYTSCRAYLYYLGLDLDNF